MVMRYVHLSLWLPCCTAPQGSVDQQPDGADPLPTTGCCHLPLPAHPLLLLVGASCVAIVMSDLHTMGEFGCAITTGVSSIHHPYGCTVHTPLCLLCSLTTFCCEYFSVLPCEPSGLFIFQLGMLSIMERCAASSSSICSI